MSKAFLISNEAELRRLRFRHCSLAHPARLRVRSIEKCSAEHSRTVVEDLDAWVRSQSFLDTKPGRNATEFTACWRAAESLMRGSITGEAHTWRPFAEQLIRFHTCQRATALAITARRESDRWNTSQASNHEMSPLTR